MKTAGLYIHIPFCKVKCVYCDFYSITKKEDQIPLFTKCLLKEIDSYKNYAGKWTFDTIFFGGGTPSLLPAKYLEQILQKGELNMTTEQRRKMVDDKRKQIINFISKTYVDPKSHLPHPPLRIEQAMTDARISIDPFKNTDEQIKDIVQSLRTIIALKSENLTLEISVPAQFVAQSYTVLKSTGTLKKEDWQPNGSLKAILEIPAAARPNVIDRLGAITKGTATVEVMK